MGAARHTQRAQEHTQRRVARDDPHPSVPASGWKPAGIKYERSGLTYDDIAALLDGTIAREKALEAERDRLRAALDEARPVLDAVREWFAGRGEDYTRHHEQELIAAYSRYRDRAGWGA